MTKQAARMDDQRIRNDIIEWLVRKKVTGAKKHQIQTVVGYALQSHEEGRGKELIEEMLTAPSVPIRGYGGGHRSNIQLTSLEAGKEYLRANGRDLPGWF